LTVSLWSISTHLIPAHFSISNSKRRKTLTPGSRAKSRFIERLLYKHKLL